MFEYRGIAPVVMPISPALDFGINMPSKKSQELKGLTADEAISMFGETEAVKMNFIPQMLVALAMDYAILFVRHCRNNGLSEFKKHNRLIRECVREHKAILAKSYGTAYHVYNVYMDRYFEYVAADRFKMRCSIGNIVNRQIANDRYREGAVLIAIIHKLIDFAEAYDRKMDKLIADKVGNAVHRNQDETLKLITAMCYEFEDSYGFKLSPDPIVDMNIAVLANNASRLAESIINKEKCQ